jgi:AcrR family transcriptional regulator
MPPDLRRAAIIDVAIPLLRSHGPAVTTRQIADAAGIAEGTLFRVFDDKEALIKAAVARVFDQRPTIEELRRIDLDAPLRQRLRAAVVVITARLDAVWELMFAMRMMSQPDHARPTYVADQADSELPDALTAVIAPDADQLRVSATQTARLLRLVTFAGSHPRITDANPLTADEIVDLLLDGLRAPASGTASPPIPNAPPTRDATC